MLLRLDFPGVGFPVKEANVHVLTALECLGANAALISYALLERRWHCFLLLGLELVLDIET